MDETAELHISSLGKYLESHLVKEQAGVSNQRQSARDKLTRLTKQQFQELSTDVYDEMSRRVLNSPEVPFLQVRDDFHPKRNQARQKLATLPTIRFKDLASDVFFELERRYQKMGNGATADLHNTSRNDGQRTYDDPYPKTQSQQFENQTVPPRLGNDKDSYKSNQNQYLGQNQYQADQAGDNRDRDPYNQYHDRKQSSVPSLPPYAPSMPGDFYTQPVPLQNAHPTSVPAPHATNPMTIVAKQQTATVQQIAPSYVVQKNSYESSSPSDAYGYQESSMNGYGSGYPKSSEPHDSSFHSSSDSAESSHAPQPALPAVSERRNDANQAKPKSGFSIDQMISKSAAAAVITPNVVNSGNRNDGNRNDVRLSTSSSATSPASAAGGSEANNIDATVAPSSLSLSSAKANTDVVGGETGTDPLAGTVNFSSLDSLMADLGSMINKNGIGGDGGADVDGKKAPESAPGTSVSSSAPNDAVVKMKKDYEVRIDGLRRRVMELEAQAADNSRVAKLEDEIAQLRAANALQLEEHRRLQEEFRELLENHKSLQASAEKSRNETESLLADLRELSREYDELRSEKGKDEVELTGLTEENSRLKKELELAKNSSHGSKAMQPSPLVSAFSPRTVIANSESILTPHEGGAIEPQRITAYQEAIDDLLRSGRSDVPTSVLMAMKAIVFACKGITEDIEAHEQRSGSNMSREEKEQLFTLKSKFSATLTNLMTAAKNHATGFGVSPVSLLDANAGNLTATVVEIVKLMKMKNVAGGGRGSFSKTGPSRESVDGGGGNRGRAGSTSSVREQKYNSTSPVVSKGSDGSQNFEVDELKVYLELQTDAIVQAIQTLLQAMRQSSYGQELFDTITSISGIVTSLVSASRATFSRPSGSRYKARGEMILRDLESSNIKLGELRNSLADESAGKPSKQRFASASFEIAKYVKELVGLIE